MTDFDKKKDAIKHDQHTDRKNTTTLFFLKNSRVLLYVFFKSKTVVFYCMFFRVKNVSETGLSVAPKFLGIGYWVLVRWVLRQFLVGKTPCRF